MREHLIPYFVAEKQEALLFMLVGVAAIAAAIWLLRSGARLKGMAYPLAAVAAIQLVVGSTVYFRTDDQVAALTAQYEADRPAFVVAERARMEAVVWKFRTYKALEIALLAIGIGLIVVLRRHDFWRAAGIGLALQSTLMLVLDLFAERRADAYLGFILAS